MTVSTVRLHAADTLKIGMVCAATRNAESGRYQRQGAELAVAEVNKAGACSAGKSNW